MKKLWNGYVKVSGFKSKVVSLGTMIIAFAIAWVGLVPLVTHDRLKGVVIHIDALCDIKCDRLVDTASNRNLNGGQCAEIVIKIKSLELENCEPRNRDYYTVLFDDATGAKITQSLSSSDFNTSHNVGDTVSMLRNPEDPSAIEPPPHWVTYIALAYGLVLLGLHIIWPLMKRRRRQINS